MSAGGLTLVLDASLVPRDDRPDRISVPRGGNMAIRRMMHNATPASMDGAPVPTMWLNGNVECRLLSRKHAFLRCTRRSGQMVLVVYDGSPHEQTRSLNGTTVDGTLVPLGGHAEAHAGSEIVFGAPQLMQRGALSDEHVYRYHVVAYGGDASDAATATTGAACSTPPVAIHGSAEPAISDASSPNATQRAPVASLAARAEPQPPTPVVARPTKRPRGQEDLRPPYRAGPPVAPHGPMLPDETRAALGAWLLPSAAPALGRVEGGASASAHVRNLAVACVAAAGDEDATDDEDEAGGRGGKRAGRGVGGGGGGGGKGGGEGGRGVGGGGGGGGRGGSNGTLRPNHTGRCALLATTLSRLGHAPPEELCVAELAQLLSASRVEAVQHAMAGLRAHMHARPATPFGAKPAALLCAALESSKALLTDGRSFTAPIHTASTARLWLLGLPLQMLCALLTRPPPCHAPCKADGPGVPQEPGVHVPAERRALLRAALALFEIGVRSEDAPPMARALLSAARGLAVHILAHVHASTLAIARDVNDASAIGQLVAWAVTPGAHASAMPISTPNAQSVGIWALVTALEERSQQMSTRRRSGMELAAEVAPAADAVAQAAAEAAAEAAAADTLLHALLIALLPRARFAPPPSTEAGRATAADSLASLAIGTNAPLDGAMLRLLWQRPSAVMGTVDGGVAQPQHPPPPPPPPPPPLRPLRQEWFLVVATCFAATRRLVRLGLLGDGPSLRATCAALGDLQRRLRKFERRSGGAAGGAGRAAPCRAAGGGGSQDVVSQQASQQVSQHVTQGESDDPRGDAGAIAGADDEGEAASEALRVAASALFTFYDAVLAPRCVQTAECDLLASPEKASAPAPAAPAARKAPVGKPSAKRRAGSLPPPEDVVVLSD